MCAMEGERMASQEILFEGDDASPKGDGSEAEEVKDGSCRRCCCFWGFNLTTLTIIQIGFLVISAIVSAVLTSQSYNATPYENWVLVGGITPTSATAKVRVPSAPQADQLFNVYTDSSDPSASVFEATILASNSQNYTQEVQILQLKNNTRYYYSLDGIPRGSFRTPGPEGEPFDFHFVVAGCAWTGSTHSVFTQMASEDPLLFLQIGDLHYEDISANDLGLRMTAIDRVMGSPSQARLFSNTALAYMWDDHDWLGNDSDGEGQGRDAALQSYQVAFPHYTPLPDNSSSLPSPYHAFTVGTVRFVLMDLRSQATDHSIYSDEQKRWLFRELDSSPSYDFVILISSKPWIDADSNIEEDDSWAAYPDNRSELSAYISSMTKKNLLMIASDAHMVAFDDGSNTFYGRNRSLSSSFPILQTGPMDRLGSVKGGPFSDGCYTIRYERSHQYSVVAFSANGSATCLTLTSKDAAGNRILTRTLCGSNIFHNTTTSGSGSCSASSISTSTTAMLGASCAILVLMGMIALKFIGCCIGLAIFCTSLVLSFATLGLGIGIPLAKGIKQFDTNAIATIVVTQVVVVFVYVLIWARIRRVSDSSDGG